MEYGLDVSLPIYSGGLGVLSGDHLKTASDLGLPLVGVGLLYRQGYFQQYLNPDGFQQEVYPENDWYNMPVHPCRDAQGGAVKVSVDVGEAQVAAQVWEVRVGQTPLYLLDTNIEDNPPADRLITATLYGGDRDMRIRQEILLGVGGIRALQALGLTPAVTHMNEGHSAFLALERMRELMRRKGVSFDEAAAGGVAHQHLHHPHPGAGRQRALPARPDGPLLPALRRRAGPFLEGLPGPGPREPGQRAGELLHDRAGPAPFGLRQRGQPAARAHLPPHVERAVAGAAGRGGADRAITNGVHPRTWISHDMIDLLDRYLGPRFQEEPTNAEVWDRIDQVSDEELWRTHERRRERLVAFARTRLRLQLKRRGATEAELAAAEDALSPYALTICFARRFASYKRASLLLRDPERLVRLLTDPQRPVQLIFAGKAHPHDLEGKEIIREIIHFAQDPQVRRRSCSWRTTT